MNLGAISVRCWKCEQKAGRGLPPSRESRNGARRPPTLPREAASKAYMLVEALVYIGVIFLLLGVGYAALYRCIDHSVSLRRNVNDIGKALQIGERWRADVRAVARNIRLEDPASEQLLHLPGSRGEIQYRFADGAVWRRVAEGAWVSVLTNVVSSRMTADQRQNVTAWVWDLELQSHAKLPQIRPIFTFIAIPAASYDK